MGLEGALGPPVMPVLFVPGTCRQCRVLRRTSLCISLWVFRWSWRQPGRCRLGAAGRRRRAAGVGGSPAPGLLAEVLGPERCRWLHKDNVVHSVVRAGLGWALPGAVRPWAAPASGSRRHRSGGGPSRRWLGGGPQPSPGAALWGSAGRSGEIQTGPQMGLLPPVPGFAAWVRQKLREEEGNEGLVVKSPGSRTVASDCFKTPPSCCWGWPRTVPCGPGRLSRQRLLLGPPGSGRGLCLPALGLGPLAAARGWRSLTAEPSRAPARSRPRTPSTSPSTADWAFRAPKDQRACGGAPRPPRRCPMLRGPTCRLGSPAATSRPSGMQRTTAPPAPRRKNRGCGATPGGRSAWNPGPRPRRWPERSCPRKRPRPVCSPGCRPAAFPKHSMNF